MMLGVMPRTSKFDRFVMAATRRLRLVRRLAVELTGLVLALTVLVAAVSNAWR
jgi:hypothetical protein